ncbi:MAG TPA: glycine oxidase ThiO [Coxiellaceae bacterium]|nr:glycine oxidase ThiO [Coxiellaceae bacterium]
MKIAVVGAGVMGQLIAFNLLKAGHTLTIFDKQPLRDKQNCSMAAAGLLTALAELEKSDKDVYDLAKDSVENSWPLILQQLTKPIYFSRKGSLLLAHPQDRSELQRFVEQISFKLSDKNNIQVLDRDAIKKLEPELEKFNEGYFFGEDAQLDNQSFMQNLTEDLTQGGVNWHHATEVTDLKPHQISHSGSTETFDWVIDCRGLGAKDQFEDLRAVRGELIWLKAPEVKLHCLVRLLHPRYHLYLVPRPEQTYILGASEIESEDYSAISVRTILELLSAAFYVHPGFAEARLIKTVTQCRPTLRDHRPKIKYQPGFVAVNGLYRHGFLLAPALAQEVVHYVQAGYSSVRYPHFWEEYDVVH